MGKKKIKLLAIFISDFICVTIIAIPYAILYVLSTHGQLTISSIPVVKIIFCVINLLFFCVLTPRVDKRVEKFLERKFRIEYENPVSEVYSEKTQEDD